MHKYQCKSWFFNIETENNIFLDTNCHLLSNSSKNKDLFGSWLAIAVAAFIKLNQFPTCFTCGRLNSKGERWVLCTIIGGHIPIDARTTTDWTSTFIELRLEEPILDALLQNFKIMMLHFLILLKNVIIWYNMLYFMALIKSVIVWHTIIPLAWYTMTLNGSIIVWYTIFSFTLYAMTLIGSIIVLLTSIIFPRHFYKCHWILPINIWLSLEFFLSAICYHQTFPLFFISWKTRKMKLESHT